jgi:hypothetical protein
MSEQEIIEAYHLIATTLMGAKPTGVAVSLCPLSNISGKKMREYGAVPEYGISVNGEYFTYAPANTMTHQSPEFLNYYDWNNIMNVFDRIEAMDYYTSLLCYNANRYECIIQVNPSLCKMIETVSTSKIEAAFISAIEFCKKLRIFHNELS